MYVRLRVFIRVWRYIHEIFVLFIISKCVFVYARVFVFVRVCI